MARPARQRVVEDATGRMKGGNDIMRSRLLITLALLGAAGLAGCRESERDRPLAFEPGVYKGEKPSPLTKSQKRELQDRHRQIW